MRKLFFLLISALLFSAVTFALMRWAMKVDYITSVSASAGAATAVVVGELIKPFIFKKKK